jgi:hypothetical protein
VKDAQDILTQKDVDKQVRRDVRKARGSWKEGQPSRRRYRICEKPSYNARTYQKAVDISSLLDSD